ncbi:MAG: SusC/RagA family TonB-linked outer membrane protein, partial [Pyrinomonadaceae bacterium]|nr:SusC/RagA family TonB-linked outer membrane protein [Sphingobacteriaceae bacterium]
RQSVANRYRSGLTPIVANIPAANLNNVNGFNIAIAEATDVNYLDQVLRDGKYQDVTLSGSTATQKTSLYGSASFRNEDGIEIGRGYKRGGFRLNGEHKALNEILTFGANISLNYIATRNPGDHFGTAQSSALPIYPLYRPDDQSLYFNGYNAAGSSVGTNPAFFRENFNDPTNTLRNISIAYVDLKPIKGLSIRSEWGYDLQNNAQDTYRSRDLFPAQAINPSARVGGNGQTFTLRFNTFAWNTNNTITYTKSFKTDHKATILGGFSAMDQNKSGRTSVFEGIPLAGNTVQATVFSIANSTETQFRFASFFSRLNYSYKDRYLLEGSIRRDGSSRFGADNMYGTFGGVSAGWIISDESFMTNSKFINYLKLRGSFGTVGNAELATDFLYLSLLSTQDSEASYGGNSGAVFNSIGNNKLKWETTVEQNIGLDFGFFSNRIFGAFEFYNKDSKDLLLASNVANSSGYLNNAYTFNVGKVNNRGVELTLNSSNIAKGDFKWSTGFNISHNVGTVKQLAPTIGSNVRPSVQSANNILVEGGNFGAYFLPVYAGTDPVTGTELIYQVDQEHMFATGETRFTGKLLDATQIGGQISRHRMLIPNKSADPKYYGGLSNDFSYKGFTLNSLLYFQVGNYVLDGGERAQSYPGETQSLRTSTLQGLTDPSYPLVFGSSLSGTNTTRWLHDGSYLRLRNVQLGYTIPSRLTQRYKANSVKLYLAGQNLWTLTKFKGWDPEVFTANNNFQNANVGAGVTGYTLPQVKTFLLGLNVKF